MTRVAITGIGIIDSLGNNVNDCWKNLLNEYDPIQRIRGFNIEEFPGIKIQIASEADVDLCDLRDVVSATKNKLPNYLKLAAHSVSSALHDSGITNFTNGAVCFSSLGSNYNTRYEFAQALFAGKTKFPPKPLLETQTDFAASFIAQNYNIVGPSINFHTSCSTFLSSLDYARRIVDEYDYVIVGGSDAMVDPGHIFQFQNLQALTTDDSRPFDTDRSGFVMGTGAGCIILEREDRAIARNAKIYGYVAGLSLTSESTSLTGSDGSSASLAIKRALNQAGLSTVDFVNAHATSTRMGDEIEYDAIVKHLPDVPITANKGKIGHTMAACGAIETIYSLLSFEHNVVPKIYNLANPIITDRNLLQHNIDKNCTSFLKNSFAFGGRSASLVVTKY